MEWIDRLNAAMACIEEHLTEETDLNRLGRVACCSAYHFQRMFACMAGITLSEYIRRRRMSLAAEELRGGMKVVDAALKYGYDSPTAFNRAFQSVHGVAPSAARSAGVQLKSYPPLRFSMQVRGAQPLEYRIEAREAFRVAGVSAPLKREIEENFEAVPALWQRAAAENLIPRLAGMMNAAPMGLLGVSACGDEEDWRYFIAVSTTLPAEDLESYTVPAATWAIFPGAGTNRSIQELERRVVTEWLPSSGYEYANGPDVEVYLNPDPNDARFEVWIPVTRADVRES